MDFKLTDKYEVNEGGHIISGIQAIVKLCLLQKEIDLRNGLDTRGFVSGYRGSPLGGLDQEFIRNPEYFSKNGVDFAAGLNEDLAATAVWGTQQIGLLSPAKYHGVYGLWYGKGPGVHRTGDCFNHANFAGTHPNGGVLAFAGDDHSCKSSTMPHQTEYQFRSWYMPVITPSNVEDVIRLGLLGFALSRYSGLWCSVKIVSDLADSFQTINVDLDKWNPTIPDKKFDVSIRWPDSGVEQEKRIHEQRLPAVQHFLKHNKFNEVIFQAKKPEIGIVAVGKSYGDLLTALQVLEIDNEKLEELGISILKIGMSWPLQQDLTEEFCLKNNTILVIEEKEPLVEDQIKSMFYNHEIRPILFGKDILSNLMDLNSTKIAKSIKYVTGHTTLELDEELDYQLKDHAVSESRTPFYCSGCPHNTSTKVPEGSVAIAGIGCHYMSIWMPNYSTKLITHMGAEGTSWIGQQQYVEADHIFANLGDGTYFHSGILAIRATVAANTTITYKILYNHAVAMTGGQQIDGALTVQDIVNQVKAEGVKHVFVVSQDTKQHAILSGALSYPKKMFDEIQKRCTKIKGVSVIIYDQECATEKRRKVKRGKQPATDTRVYINPDICEGCGDCSVKSNCLSVAPYSTELGTKRRIIQDECNHDLSCLEGFCPSFITVHGATVKKPDLSHVRHVCDSKIKELTKPELPKINGRYNIVLSGIGGAGVISASRILGVAAHLQDIKVCAIDQTGLAQKFGDVSSFISVGDEAVGKASSGTIDLLIGCDLQTASSQAIIEILNNKKTHSVLNTQSYMNGKVVTDKNWKIDSDNAILFVKAASKSLTQVDASTLTKIFTGDRITNIIFLLGVAYQKGLLPIEEEYIFESLNLNRVKYQENINAWYTGRIWANDPASIEVLSDMLDWRNRPVVFDTFDKSFTHRASSLVDYWNAGYSKQYTSLIEQFCNKEESVTDRTELSDLVMRSLYKFMAYKDEYEVARLHIKNLDDLDAVFNDIRTIKFSFSLPWQHRSHKKTSIGAWIIPVLKILQHGKYIRESWLDLFRWTSSRRLDIRMRYLYTAMVKKWINELTEENYDYVLEKAREVDKIGGFGYIKKESFNKYVKDSIADKNV